MDTFSPLPCSLQKGMLLKRYKRFLADIVLEDGTHITAHCPNTGAMQGVSDPGRVVWVSKKEHLARGARLSYTWEATEEEGTMVGINTGWPNRLLKAAISENAHAFSKMLGVPSDALWQYEVSMEKGWRVDAVAAMSPHACPLDSIRSWCVEVKNVHYKRGRVSVFPDCVTARGARHVQSLKAGVLEGKFHASVVYIVQRDDVEALILAPDMDAAYTRACVEAKEAGVSMHAFTCMWSREGVRLHTKIPLLHLE